MRLRLRLSGCRALSQGLRSRQPVSRLQQQAARRIVGCDATHGDRVPLLAPRRTSLYGLERLFNGAVQQQDVAKVTITALADRLERTVPDIARIVGQREAEKNAIPELLVALKGLIDSWRRL